MTPTALFVIFNAEGMLRDIEAAKALFEKVGLFKAPELLEKYVIASEVTVEVLDLFLSRVFGTERAWISRESGDLKALWESLGCCSWSEGKGAASGDLSARADEQMEGLRVKVHDLERQLCAVQRHLQMQGEVSRLAVKKALFEQSLVRRRDIELRLIDCNRRLRVLNPRTRNSVKRRRALSLRSLVRRRDIELRLIDYNRRLRVLNPRTRN